MTEAQYHLVLGGSSHDLVEGLWLLCYAGQQILWTEQSGPENLDSIVWPRAASSAEVFWSAKQPGGAPLNVTEALPRLHVCHSLDVHHTLSHSSQTRTSDSEWYSVALGLFRFSPSGARCVLTRATSMHKRYNYDLHKFVLFLREWCKMSLEVSYDSYGKVIMY